MLAIDILGDGTETVMILRYERLPNHCFKCGMVVHSTSDYSDKVPIPITNGKKTPLFGAWLRALGPLRKYHDQYQKGMVFSPTNFGNY